MVDGSSDPRGVVHHFLSRRGISAAIEQDVDLRGASSKYLEEGGRRSVRYAALKPVEHLSFDRDRGSPRGEVVVLEARYDDLRWCVLRCQPPVKGTGVGVDSHRVKSRSNPRRVPWARRPTPM